MGGSVAVACRLWSAGSVVVLHGAARGPGCPKACGILVPGQGIEPASLALAGEFLTPGPPGKSPFLSLLLTFSLANSVICFCRCHMSLLLGIKEAIRLHALLSVRKLNNHSPVTNHL